MRLLRVYELLILYLLAMIYIAIRWFSPISIYDNTDFVFFETAVVLLFLYIVREIVMLIRLNKLNAETICVHRTYTYVIRAFVVIGYYALMWYSGGSRIKVLIVLIGIILNYLLPRPISEGVFSTEEGFILKGLYFEFEAIEGLELMDSGDLKVRFHNRTERIAYHTKGQKKRIYDFLLTKKPKCFGD